MSDETACMVLTCGRPADGWFVCPTCAETFTHTLAEIPWMLEELDVVVTQQTRYGTGPKAKSAETPLMFNPKASDTRAELVNEIQNAARLVAEANGWKPTYTTVEGCAAWLERSISAIRLHPLGGEIINSISGWYAASLYVIDRPAQRQFLGDCATDESGQACGGRIYGKAGKPEARCDTCGQVYMAELLRAGLLKELDDRLCTAAEIARLSTYLGLDADRETVRKRINQWVKRDQIKPRRTTEDGDLYRFGEVYEKLCQDDTTRRTA